MKNTYKKKSFFYRLLDKIERRNRGNFFLLINYYYLYFLCKFKNITKDKRAHILKKITQNSIIAEIGVWRGDFSKEIYNICKPKELVLVDPWNFDNKIRGCAPQIDGKEPLRQKYFDEAKFSTLEKFKNFNNVKIIIKYSAEASKLFPDNYFDYIYIDGEHSYEAVSKDLINWYPKLKKNGILYGDDYYWREEDNTFSLHKAYQDFINKYNIQKWCVFKSQVCLIKNND